MNLGPDLEFRLSDRYRATTGEVLLTGVQALVRAPIDQVRRDRTAGHNTAAFVSGYQGSPLGGYDRELLAQHDLCSEYGVVVRPGLNEESGATAVAGSQLVQTLRTVNRDGVSGYWYGKGPGLDRAVDALRHANFAGTSPLGGVLMLVGDDPACKSSTLPSRCDPIVASLGMALLEPGTMQDVLDLAVHGIAMSRASGLWTGLKIITPVADGSGLASVDGERLSPIVPLLEVNGAPWKSKLWPVTLAPMSLAMEAEVFGPRHDMARAYMQANHLNQFLTDPADAWLGIIAAGHNAELVTQTLRNLGITEDQAAGLGIRILKLRAVLPRDDEAIRRLARGVKTVMVVEEKRSFIEAMVRDALYGAAQQPTVIGKLDAEQKPLIGLSGALSVEILTEPLRRVLLTTLPADKVPAPRQRRPLSLTVQPDAVRGAYFCSGCPHSTSTVVPEGSLVGLGIGCHGMVAGVENGERGEFTTITQMGGEGMHWVGMAPFSDTKHMFQNIGDGTFFHSGQLSIQAAMAAGVSVTYKILYNAAVAMTGGQDATGLLTVPQVAAKLLAEGVKKVAITTDDPDKYANIALADGVKVHHRDDIIKVQEQLRAISGVTILIHDQQCAAEKRRDRKRGILETPKTRIVIDHRVCEGCGDCGVQSNCLSLEPIETEFGRKTKIDQTSCNIDTMCLKGDCPAFVTVEPDTAPASAKRSGAGTGSRAVDVDVTDLPSPTRIVPTLGMTIRMPGIGGTGVVTTSQVLLAAAKIEGMSASAVDQTGLSQKGGPVLSTVSLGTPSPGRVELLLAFDLLSAVTVSNVEGLDAGWTHVIANTHVSPTGKMIGKVATASLDTSGHQRELDERSGPHNHYLDASTLTTGLLGNALTANTFIVGVAYQSGMLPLQAESIEQAIELNGASVDANRAAFRWGRRWAAAPGEVEARIASHAHKKVDTRGLTDLAELGSASLVESVAIRRAELTAYQNKAYADDFVAFVRSCANEERRAGGDGSFTSVVAHQLHRVMAYKDEYEVARLLLDGGRERIEDALGKSAKSITWNLHPPMLRSAGMKKKLKFSESTKPALAALRPMKRLRGTALDPFGRAVVRKEERALIKEYRATVEALLPTLAVNSQRATRIAGLVDHVRGFEDVKMRKLAEYRSLLAAELER